MGVTVDAYACWHLPEREASSALSARDDGQWVLVRVELVQLHCVRAGQTGRVCG
jgi:hypothetical protein